VKDCKECHHLPSGRFNCAGQQCYCKCHDVADQAPELLSTLNGMLGLCDLLCARRPMDLPAEVEWMLQHNHRVEEARAVVERIGS
jgi:hypothetical protein